VSAAQTVSRVFEIKIAPTTFLSRDVKIHLDCTHALSWAEVDCVALRGIRLSPDIPLPTPDPIEEEIIEDNDNELGFVVTKDDEQVAILPRSSTPPPPEADKEIFQWVIQANVSSFYGTGWGPDQLRGPPKVYPMYGDSNGAWAAKRSSGTKETLQLNYKEAVYMTGAFVFETYNPGHVKKITSEDETGEIHTIWEINEIIPEPLKSRILSILCDPTPFLTKSITIHMDCTKAKSWAEVDCVALRGYRPNPITEQEVQETEQPPEKSEETDEETSQ